MRPLLVVLYMILLTAFARVIPHPPNFTPVVALGLFGAAVFRNKWVALLSPVAAMAVGDVMLECVTRLGLTQSWMSAGQGFHEGWWTIYLTVFLVTAFGFVLRDRLTLLNVVGTSLAASTLFFVLTNFAVWASQGMYPMTGAGLLECYVAAVPFFGNTVVGDLAFCGAFFGVYALALRPKPEPAVVRV